MPGLIPQFTQKGINGKIDRFVNNKAQKILYVLNYVGDEFVTQARNTKTYKDQTGNLRASIGYLISLDGKILIEKEEGTSEGVAKAKETLREVLRNNQRNFVLIVCAGMGYAAAVESKGYDVITGSIPNAETLLRELKTKTGLR